MQTEENVLGGNNAGSGAHTVFSAGNPFAPRNAGQIQRLIIPGGKRWLRGSRKIERRGVKRPGIGGTKDRREKFQALNWIP